jgi:hypothetical protein
LGESKWWKKAKNMMRGIGVGKETLNPNNEAFKISTKTATAQFYPRKSGVDMQIGACWQKAFNNKAFHISTKTAAVYFCEPKCAMIMANFLNRSRLTEFRHK